MKVQDLNGTLPEFWDRRTVFVAHLLSLFFGNQEETDALSREAGTLETYGNRQPRLSRCQTERGA